MSPILAAWNDPGYGRLGERHWAMIWAQRLMRVFKLDLERYEGCGG